MSFGVSIGDVIVCSKLALNAYSSLKDAPKEFEGLRLEVLSLNATLRALAEEADSPNSIILLASPQRQESLRVLLENCKKGLQQLQVLTSKFPSLGSNEKTKFLEHVKFALQSKNGPRDKLAIHTASINIFLTSLTHSSLGRLEGLIKNALRGSQQRQQNVQSQFASIGHETIGKKSFAALAGGDFGASQTKGPDVWDTIAQDLEWEGIQSENVKPYKDEVVAYIRHLQQGGLPFYKLSDPTDSSEARTRMHSRPMPSMQERIHERQDKHRPQRQPTAPPVYSADPPSSQNTGFGSAPSGLYGAPQQRIGSTKPISFGSSPSRRDDTVAEETKRLERLRLDTERMKQSKEEQPQSTSGASELPQSLSRPSPNSPPTGTTSSQLGSSLFGAPQCNTSLSYSQPEQQKGKHDSSAITSGSLFGSVSQTTPTTSGFGRSSSASPFAQQTTGGLFGNAAQSSATSGSLFGPTSTGNPFIPINEKQVDEMADLFDHMFDVDEAEIALAQGVAGPPDAVLLPQNEAAYQKSNAHPFPTHKPSSPSFGGLSSSHDFHHVFEYPDSPQTRMPPPITPDTPLELQRARLRIVRGQLEALLEKIYAAHRAGDTKLPHLLMQAGPHNDESPIRTRVDYLRSAGVIVVNCDLCSTPVPDYHWHCDVCAGGDWDMCFRCRNLGRECPGRHGYLMRRSAREWEKERYWTNI